MFFQTSVRWQRAQIICLTIIRRLIAALRKKVVGIRPLLGDSFPPHAPPMLFMCRSQRGVYAALKQDVEIEPVMSGRNVKCYASTFLFL